MILLRKPHKQTSGMAIYPGSIPPSKAFYCTQSYETIRSFSGNATRFQQFCQIEDAEMTEAFSEEAGITGKEW